MNEMQFAPPVLVLIQSPFIEEFDWYFDALRTILNILYALSIHGYFILILIGFMIYATGISDGAAKSLVLFGIFLFFGGPFVANFFSGVIGVAPLTPEGASSTFYGYFGIYEAELIALLAIIGNAVMAICLLIGAILYFTPTSPDLKSRGYSLLVRGVILAGVMAFFYTFSLI